MRPSLTGVTLWDAPIGHGAQSARHTTHLITLRCPLLWTWKCSWLFHSDLAALFASHLATLHTPILLSGAVVATTSATEYNGFVSVLGEPFYMPRPACFWVWGEGMASFDLSVFLKRHWYPLTASALIICGVAARLALTLIGWPHTDSEEGTMGLEAMHILLRGERPIYLYGQNYMGVGEAYLGALAFKIFGISIVSLRIGVITFYAIFMVGVFWLANLLYSRRVTLLSLAALVLGTPFTLRAEMFADGGKAETLAFGAMMLALASWLALSPPSEQTPRGRRALRYAGFLAWGIAAGLGLYTYTVVAPFVLTSGLLLLLTCWRELRGWLLALPLIGLLIGLLPDIIYTVTMPLADNPISVFLSLHQYLNAGGAGDAYAPVKQVVATLLYTLPTVTGLVVPYPLQALPLYGPLGLSTFAAVILGGGWGLGYLFLLGVATYRPLRALRHYWAPRWMAAQSEGDAQAPSVMARDAARLAIPLTAWLTIAAYTFSATAANNPYSGRYMIGLLVITPAVIWPLVDWAPRMKGARAWLGGMSLRDAWRPAGVALLGASLVWGVVLVAQSTPDEVAASYRDAKLTHDLLNHGVTRFYSDYWTCDLLNFASREQLICSVIDNYARLGRTRYLPYYAAVRADPSAPYVLIQGSTIERTFLIRAADSHWRYTMTRLDGRDLYTIIKKAA